MYCVKISIRCETTIIIQGRYFQLYYMAIDVRKKTMKIYCNSNVCAVINFSTREMIYLITINFIHAKQENFCRFRHNHNFA